jgi:CDP-diacylglycerol--glycerol-3-phosphate 3-phosphatidyltransferase
VSFATAGILLLAALSTSLPIYLLRARGRPIDLDVSRRSTTLLFGARVRDWAVWVLGPVERGLLRSGVTPDALNFLGAAAGIAAGAAFAAGELGLAAWLLAVGGISDILDGRVARARGIASRYGAFLDSTLDRFAETGTFIGVAWYLTGAPWLTAAALLAVSGSLLVSYTRARGEALGAPFSGGLMQRAERVVLLILGALLDAPVTGRTGWAPGTLLAGTVVLIAFGTLATAIYRAVVIARRLAKAEAGSGGTDV